MLIWLTSLTHIGTGAAYILGLSVLVIMDLFRVYRRTGRIIWFGVALLCMGVTCGPHHLEHGLHQLLSLTPTTAPDLVSALFTLPPASIWLYLQVETFMGKKGDRTFTKGTKLIAFIPIIYFMITGLCIFGPLKQVLDAPKPNIFAALPQVALVFAYMAIGYTLITTQWDLHRAGKPWSLSSLALGWIFPTCAVAHMIYALEIMRDFYPIDWHLFTIDTAGLGAAIWFNAVIYFNRRKLRKELAQKVE